MLYALAALCGIVLGLLGLAAEPLLLAIRERRKEAEEEADGPSRSQPRQPNRSTAVAERVFLPLALGLVFGLIAWRYGWGHHRLEMVLACLYSLLLFEIAIIDLHTRLVLNILSFPAAVVAVVGTSFWSGIGLGSALLGGAAALAIFVLIEIVGRGAMGRGDTKLAAVIGLMRGFPTLFQALIIGILVGGLFAAGLLATGRGRKGTFAYGPALAIGAVVSLLVTVR